MSVKILCYNSIFVSLFKNAMIGYIDRNIKDCFHICADLRGGTLKKKEGKKETLKTISTIGMSFMVQYIKKGLVALGACEKSQILSLISF